MSGYTITNLIMLRSTLPCKTAFHHKRSVAVCRAQRPGSFPKRPRKEQIAELEKLLEAALKEQGMAFEYETVDNFIVASELVDELSFAYRRKLEDLQDAMEEYCAGHPGEAECRTYDI